MEVGGGGIKLVYGPSSQKPYGKPYVEFRILGRAEGYYIGEGK